MNAIPIVWTPNGTHIAVFNTETIFLLPAKGGTPQLLYTPKISFSVGEAGDSEDFSVRLVNREYETNPLQTRFLLQAPAFGLLLGTDLQKPDGGLDTWGLVSLDGKLVWSDGRQAVAYYDGFIEGYDNRRGNEPFVLIDLQIGKFSLLKIRPRGVILGWSADGKSIYYGTRSGSDWVQGKSDAPVVREVLDNFLWPFAAEENILTLWRIPLDAPDKSKAVKVYETKGFNFGVLTVSDTNQPLVFSVVQSSIPMVKAINSGAIGKR